MTSSSNAPTLQPDELTLHLIASGVTQLAQKVSNGVAPTLPYPIPLQKGLDRLLVACLRQQKTPPQGIPDLLAWCRRPLVEWQLALPPDAISPEDRLLDGQLPTSICEEWACTIPHVEDELTQSRLMQSVFEICRSAEAPDSYVAFRRLLISKPVLTAFELLQHCAEPQLERLTDPIRAAYEPAPDACAVEENFQCCPSCNNLMLCTVSGNLVCADECCRAAKPGGEGRKIPKRQGVHWLKRGLRRFIAAPGRVELRLAKQLRDLELDVELWPAFDSYDLRLVFPDGETWAVDVKDWASPFHLARQVKPIPSYPPWQKAYFVFPDARRQQRSDYLRAFRNHCPLPRQQAKAAFESDFINQVKRKRRECQ